MKMTSAEAAKLLNRLKDEYQSLLDKEEMSKEFLAASGEDIESVRPEYDFAATQKALEELEAKTRKVKHALNVFNSTTAVPGFNMTIDEMLVYIPQLTKAKARLGDMRSKLPKQRENSYNRVSAILDYRYTNYDVSLAESEYVRISERLSAAQLALDAVNSTATMEIDI